MLNLGLSAADLAATEAAFGGNYRMRRSVRILDLDHNLIEDVSDKFLDGQVNVDNSAEVSRSATVSLFDPTHAVGIDTSNPAAGVVSPRYLLELKRGLYVDAIDDWVDIPAGVLWLTKPARTGDVLTLEAQGKEAIARYPIVRQVSIGVGMNKMTAIRTLMESIGETRFRLESTTAKITTAFVATVDTNLWKVCKDIAAGMGWQLFYDAEGYVVCRPAPSAAVFAFRCGNGGTVRSEPQFSFADEVYNYVQATGGTPQGWNVPIIKTAQVANSHQLYITRNGQFIPLRFDTSNDKLLTYAAVRGLASDALAQVVLDTQSATWDSSPVWHLDEGDLVVLSDGTDAALSDASYSLAVPLRTFSFPLTLGSQSNGYLKRVARSTRRLVAA